MTKILFFEISLLGADEYALTEQTILRRELKRRKIFGIKFLYSAFSPLYLDRIKATGSYRFDNEIFCCRVEKIDGQFCIIDDSHYDLIDYLIIHDHGNSSAFAVYDASMLEEVDDHPCYVFKFPKKKLRALKAVVTVVLYPHLE